MAAALRDGGTAVADTAEVTPAECSRRHYSMSGEVIYAETLEGVTIVST
jgi:hypothetical protein